MALIKQPFTNASNLSVEPLSSPSISGDNLQTFLSDLSSKIIFNGSTSFINESSFHRTISTQSIISRRFNTTKIAMQNNGDIGFDIAGDRKLELTQNGIIVERGAPLTIGGSSPVLSLTASGSSSVLDMVGNSGRVSIRKDGVEQAFITSTGKITANKFETGEVEAINDQLTVKGSIFATGDVVGNSDLSDINLKDNISKITNALDKVKEIGGYTFNYINEPDKRYAGVIAQDVMKVLPEVVFLDYQGNMAVRYGNLVSLLIEAVKELSYKVDTMEARKWREVNLSKQIGKTGE